MNAARDKPTDDAALENSGRVTDTMLLVETPEKIAFQYQLVGPFRRVLAYGLDLLFSLVGYTIVVIFFGILLSMLAAYTQGTLIGSIIGAIGQISGAIILIGYFLVYWFYGAFMEARYNGQTLGKMITKHRVLSHDGHAIDVVQALLRNFFRLLDLFPVIPFPLMSMVAGEDIPPFVPTGLFGLVTMSLSGNFRRLGDLVAGTIVVVDERKWVPELASFTDPRVEQLADELPSDFSPSQSMLRALADYVDRRRYLSPETNQDMAKGLAVRMLKKFGLPMNTDYDLLLCAMYYNAFMQFQMQEGAK
ncbi:RDD family protein [Mariniblastus fucicola]|uniref:RDD family protein n=1 Tax=Mariniblastus fucicola TaxID=980251 RepID=A0A5B9P8L2_9BACT|nr:RDD family protein [Mariniblastus fucicola]QEG21210.1 RDD family protein [Mariniblastus fucicola]